MASTYQQTWEKDIQDRVRSRYRASIAEIKALNFQELCFFRETARALGFSNGPFGPLGVLAAVPKEVLKLGRDLSASAFYVLLVSRDYDTYVAPFGLGVKFYTSFTDGTCAITTNFLSQDIHDDGEKLYKSAQPGSIAAAWEYHQTWVNNLTASGKQRQYHLSFDDFAKLACKEDSYMLKPKFTSNAMFGDIGSMLLGGIIFGCLLAATVLFLLFWPSLARTLYPACAFVKDQGKIPLLPGFAILVAGVVISWPLARIQRTMFLYDGIGTMLHGRTLLPDSSGYISTRWLVFLHLPLLPVRSYQIAEEVVSSPAQKLPVIRPLDQLHREQIKETYWQFKWWYAAIVLAWIGWGVWTFWKCI